METKTIKGITADGFEYEINSKRIENYELIEALAEVDENPLFLPKVIKLLFGVDQEKKLKDFCRDECGIVSTEKMTKVLMDVFDGQKQTKNL